METKFEYRIKNDYTSSYIQATIEQTMVNVNNPHHHNNLRQKYSHSSTYIEIC